MTLLTFTSKPPTYATEQIDKIIADKIICTTDGGTRWYLVHWKGKPESDNTWLDREDVQRLDPDALEQYESSGDIHSTGASFPHAEELMRTSDHVHVTDVSFSADDTSTC